MNAVELKPMTKEELEEQFKIGQSVMEAAQKILDEYAKKHGLIMGK